MPAERSVDQRLSAIERRLDAPVGVQTPVEGSSVGDRPRESDARGFSPATGTEDVVEDAPSTEESRDPSSTAGAQDPPSTANPLGTRQPSEDGKAASTGAPTDIEARLDAVEAELAELQAGLQALRGYVGNVDHVNEAVERRANAALAAVERLEATPTTPPSLASVSEPPDRDWNEPAARDGDPSALDDVEEDATDVPVDDASGDAENGGTVRRILDRLSALG